MKQAEYFGGEDSSPKARKGVVCRQFFQASLKGKDRVEKSLRAEMEALARSSYSVFVSMTLEFLPMRKPTKHMPCCRQKAIWIPSLLLPRCRSGSLLYLLI